MKRISIIIPCYNEEEAIPIFYKAIQQVKQKMSYEFELIFINDGSNDRTLEVIKEYAKKNQQVKFISFSRNFGKEAAMYAGFKLSTGDYVTSMDVDLQDPPELLVKMVDGLEKEGYDCVAAKSTSRHGYSFLRKTFTKWFYFLIDKISKVKMVPGARDYRLMTRQMVNSIIEMKEYNRYSKGLFEFVGFNTKWIEYENIERVAGKTKFPFKKLFLYAIDGIVSFSTIPLAISYIFGILFSLTSFIIFLTIMIKLILGNIITNTLIITCIIFLVGGINLVCLGILGEYLSRSYMEIQKRPLYIIKETNMRNIDEKS